MGGGGGVMQAFNLQRGMGDQSLTKSDIFIEPSNSKGHRVQVNSVLKSFLNAFTPTPNVLAELP